MRRLFKIELLKTFGYSTFWALLLLHAFLYIIVIVVGANVNINIQGIEIIKLFSFKYVWGTVAWVASWFNLLLGILVIILVGNEFIFNTFRKQLIDGLTRDDLLYGKFMIIIGLSVYAVILVSIVGFIVGHTSSGTLQGAHFDGYKFVLVLGIQALGYMSLALLFVSIFKNVAFSIVMYLLYFIIIEPFTRLFFSSNIDSFFPVKIISNLTPRPDFWGIISSNLSGFQVNGSSLPQPESVNPDAIPLSASVLVCLLYIIAFTLVSRFIIKSKDL